MKKILFILLIVCSQVSFGQFKRESENIPSIKESITHSADYSSLFGFINPEDYKLSHNVNMSFSTLGGQSIMLGSYTGSMYYKISDKINVAVDASLVTSPYNSLGQKFTKSINGVYITRAQINYQISKNSFIKIQYYNPIGGAILPYNYFSGYKYFGNYEYPQFYDDE